MKFKDLKFGDLFAFSDSLTQESLENVGGFCLYKKVHVGSNDFKGGMLIMSTNRVEPKIDPDTQVYKAY